MGLLGWIFYFVLGFIFFLIIEFFVNKYKISKIEKLVISIILMMIVSGFCFTMAIHYTDNIFLSFVFLMVVDLIYHSYFIETDFFDRNEKNIEYYIVLILVGFFVNQEFINDVTEVFLTGEDLRIVLWFLSMIFIYNFCRDKNIFNSNHSSNDLKYMSNETVLVHYAKLKYKYYDYCDFDNKELSNLVYAIMILENSRRSKILRDYDYFMFRLNGNKRKLGIMQVESSSFISDADSIKIVFEQLEKLYLKKNTTKGTRVKDKIYRVIDEYCLDDAAYVKYIFDIIKKF